MKKLMIALAAAATAVFAFGEDVLPHGADFENANYTAGENFTNYVNKADDGVATSGNRYWYSTSDDIGVISNHAAALDVPVPDLYKDATPKGGDNFLQLDTQAPLFRTIKSNDQSGSFTGVEVSTGDGVYLDTLVKFTAADEPFGTNSLEAVDKIAIEYVEREDDDSTPEVNEALTNFVVRAGFIVSQNQLVATNYVVALPEGWLANNKKDDWHRLTVRSLTNIDEYNRVGFKIYLDEAPLVYLTDKDEFAQSAGIDDGDHVIFPSAVETDKNNYDEISAVAFSGNGSIDDVVFTTNKPIFIAKSEAVVVPFVADAGVTAISVSVDGEDDPFPVVNGAATLPAQTADFTVNVTVDEANGYTFGSMTVGDAVYNTNPASVTGYAGGDITITTIRNNFNLFASNGDPIQGTFQTLSEALAEEGVAMIKLAYDYVVAENEVASFVTYDIDNDVTLDLNGNTITAVDTQEEVLFTVGAGAELVVIDSVGGGAIDYDTEYGVFGGEGKTVVGATSGDFGPAIIGPLLDAEEEPFVLVVRAKLDGEGNSDTDDNFAFEDYIAKGSDVSDELVGGYWVVAPQGGSEPTEIAVPTAIEGLVYNKSEQTGVVGDEGYTLVGNVGTNAGSYTAVATLQEGYAWVGGSTDPTNIVWYIGMKGVTPTIVMDPTSATFDSNKTNVADYVTSVVAYDGEDLLTENLDYYVSGLTEKVTEAGEYKVWVIQKAWSEGQNYMITNSQYATLTITAGGGSNWPAGWNGGTEPASMATAFDAWVAAGNDPTATNAEAAFLVGVDVDDYTSDLAAASISIVGGKIVITGNYNLSNVNGALAVKMGDAPNALGEPTAVTAVEGAISLTPALGETKKFYKLVIGYPAN